MATIYNYQDYLQTERLLTRFLQPEDALIWANFFEDEQAIAFFPPSPFSSNQEKASGWIERQLTRYRENRMGLQALINRQTGEFIGQCGLLTQEVDGVLEIEVGYHILPKYWGQGYAPEAARHFIGYAFKHHLTNSVISIIDIRNIKSQRVAEKNGLRKEKQTQWSGIDVYIYRISQEK